MDSAFSMNVYLLMKTPSQLYCVRDELTYTQKGNGNPLQYSSLENPMDRGAWRATVHRVAKSWTRLKRVGTAQNKTRRQKEIIKYIIQAHSPSLKLLGAGYS